MKKLLLILSLFGFSLQAVAGKVVSVRGAQYLETGEEVFKMMDPKGIRAGDIVKVVDKEDRTIVLRGQAKEVTETSVTVLILTKKMIRTSV